MVNKKDVNSLYQEFKEQAEALSARVYRVTGMVEAGRQLAGTMQELQARKAVVANSPLVSACLANTATGGVALYDEKENLRQKATDADLGISEADLAIAETGTLAQDSTSAAQRLVSTLPPAHVVLVSTGRLVKQFSEAINYFNTMKDDLPGYIAFISGPSRTADIERVLTIGVHGPGQLHIIFIDQAGGEPGDR